MKKQLSKNLSAFIIMMFSISFVNAQCKSTQTLMYKHDKSGCTTRCVFFCQVDKYISKGWTYVPCSSPGKLGIIQNSNKILQRRLPKIPVDNTIDSNKF